MSTRAPEPFTSRSPLAASRIVRRAAVVVAAAILVGACSGSSDTNSSETTSTSPDGRPQEQPAQPLEPLHAVRGDQPAVLDALGRQVLLRGMNLNGLGDYYQANPELIPNVAVKDADFEEMAALGFNVVRLLVSWSRLQPERGTIDEEYIAEIKAAVETAAENDIYTVLDMHQDAWSKYVATPPGETCPDGRGPAKGWDGAPEWATITDGGSTCIVGDIRESSDAVSNAFENFWTNRDGIQDEFVSAWVALVGEFAAEPAVAGYDLFNEPSSGTDLGAEPARLGEFYERLIQAIRTAEGGVDGGFEHVVFFEPHGVWSGFGVTAVPPATFTDDTNIVFSPHLYGGSIAKLVTIEEGFAHAAEVAAAFGTTFWSGEWGWFGDDPESIANVAEYARLEDQYLIGGAWWQWFQACGDPHSVHADNGYAPRSDVLVHFRRTSCPSNEDLGPVEEFATILSRVYPRAAPGRLTKLVSDPATGAALIEGEAEPGGVDANVVDLWVPGSAETPPTVAGRGVLDSDVTVVPGGFRVRVEVESIYSIDVSRG